MKCEELEKFKEPLYFISYDNKNREYVCEYENRFINFDKAKGLLRKSNVGKTPDCFYIDEDKKEIWFIEIKSSQEKNLKNLQMKIELKKKLFAGLIIFYELCCLQSCLYKDYKKYYFIIYDKNYNSFEDEVIDNFAVNSIRDIEFGLEDLKPQFVNEIFTENCEYFTELFSIRFGIDFMKREI